MNFKPPFGTEIDWGSPASQGLVCAYPFNEFSGLRMHDASHSHCHLDATIGVAGGIVSWSGNDLYCYGNGPDGTHIITSQNPPLSNSTEITIATEIELTEAQRDAYSFICELSNVYYSNNAFALWTTTSGLGDFQLWWGIHSTTGNKFSQWFVRNLSHNVRYHIVATANRATGVTQIYLNGILSGEAQVQDICPGTWGDYPMYVGWRGFVAEYGLRGNINHLNIYNREMAAKEAQDVYNNSFDMYRKPDVPELPDLRSPERDVFLADHIAGE